MEHLINDIGEVGKRKLFDAMFDGLIMKNYKTFCLADIQSTFQSQGFSGEEIVKHYARYTRKAINDSRIEVVPSLNDLRKEGELFKVTGIDKRKKTTDLI